MAAYPASSRTFMPTTSGRPLLRTRSMGRAGPQSEDKVLIKRLIAASPPRRNADCARSTRPTGASFSRFDRTRHIVLLTDGMTPKKATA